MGKKWLFRFWVGRKRGYLNASSPSPHNFIFRILLPHHFRDPEEPEQPPLPKKGVIKAGYDVTAEQEELKLPEIQNQGQT